MDDPWDVKSVKQSRQYVSCMKINGIPLLPPILSKECRKEMQYYKLLAQEVEKRISLLKPLINENNSDTEETDAPELLEFEQYQHSSIAIDRVSESLNYNTLLESYEDNKENVALEPPNFVIDLNLNISKHGNTEIDRRRSQQSSPITEVPERDCNCVKNLNEIRSLREETDIKIEKLKGQVDDVRFTITMEKGLNHAYHNDGPSSLSSKSFTGSLVNIHTESIKEHNVPTLVRQRSYTILEPSPQLLAHLKVQSQNTGVEVTSISMSDSLSNLVTPVKKRRSWDLESAKSKWSSMAVELNKNSRVTRSPIRKSSAQSAQRARSMDPEKKKQNTFKTWPPKSEARKQLTPHNQTITKEVKHPVKVTQLVATTPKPEGLDPAIRIRELYERIQNQQLVQMAHLVEKQKKEQMMLQQVFEEQNSLFFKQLKTIAPKQTIEVKEAWGERSSEQKPVSLSQLINHTPKSSDFSSTLTETKNNINHCEDVLKKSRDISKSLKKERRNDNETVNRSRSPVARTTPRRRIVYESSSSDREFEPLLTDRTNDTMADLNVTFSTDDNDPYYSKNTVVNNINNITVVKTCAVPNRTLICDSEDMSDNTVGSPRMSRVCMKNGHNYEYTDRERLAASIIVAHSKGYLTRRLMRTEKVQGTVLTIKDALLCALQLHQDREGIRGADVDLHRRLIQQITAACYSLHDTLVASTPAQRCALIAADRARKLTRTRNSSARSSFSRGSPGRNSFNRSMDIMSASYSAPARKRASIPSAMTQSNYESCSQSKSSLAGSTRCPSPRRKPWR